MNGAWLDSFQPFSTTHAIVILTFITLTFAMVITGLRWRNATKGLRFERTVGAAILFGWLIINIYQFSSDEFDPAQSLPLHLCDIAAPIAALALITRARSLRAILYFWGIGLNTQAFITPLLQSGPAHFSFWAFWGLHFAIVSSAIYDLIVRRFRPTWRDYAIAVIASAAYLALVLPIDIAFGFNYGYVGNTKPHRATIIDALGPWPQRIAVISFLVCAVMALLMLPWQIARNTATKNSTAD